ncbi:MAG: saccharopine dehydrogenase NADP-binding domain-containing protein [Flammeovirgaceae bacterium]
MDNPPKILVIGSAGVLGKLICKRVIQVFGKDALVIADYLPKRLIKLRLALNLPKTQQKLIHTAKAEDIRTHITEMQLVIVAFQQEYPLVQKICIEEKVSCVDVSIKLDFIEEALRLQQDAQEAGVTCLLTAGLFPGLSGLMVKKSILHFDTPHSVDVGLCRPANRISGKMGLADLLELLSQPVLFRSNGSSRVVQGFSMKRTIPYLAPIGKKKHRLINAAETEILTNKLNIPKLNFWTGFDRKGFDKFVSVLRNIRILNIFRNGKYRKSLGQFFSKERGQDHPAGLTVVSRGYSKGQKIEAYLSLIAASDYLGTAACAVSFAKTLLENDALPKGIYFPFELFELQDVLKDIDDVVKGYEFNQMMI